jgi:tetratricopeptide (TPR) repeat protein
MNIMEGYPLRTAKPICNTASRASASSGRALADDDIAQRAPTPAGLLHPRRTRSHGRGRHLGHLWFLVFFCCAPAFAQTSLYYVDAQPVLKVRAGPSGEATEIDKLPYGKAVRIRDESQPMTIVAGKQGRWVWIQYSGERYGYVFSAFLAKPNRSTRSFQHYYRGNKVYRAGNYYQAVAHFQRSVETADNEPERMKALGALAQNSKQQGNMPIARMYAEQILDMDSNNEFALGFVARSSYNAYGCPDRTAVCLAVTWGPDVCGWGFNGLAQQIGGSVPNIASSPACLALISEGLDEAYSGDDLGVAIVTGMLDDLGSAGLNSQSSFENIFGGLAYAASLAIKFNMFSQCMAKCP